MADHSAPMALATAAMMDIISRGQALQAAIVRGSGQQEAETLRMAGMAAAEAYFDRMAEAAHAVRKAAP